MPKIQWTNLPPALRDHLFDRVRERKIDTEDLWRLPSLAVEGAPAFRPRFWHVAGRALAAPASAGATAGRPAPALPPGSPGYSLEQPEVQAVPDTP